MDENLEEQASRAVYFYDGEELRKLERDDDKERGKDRDLNEKVSEENVKCNDSSVFAADRNR